MSEELLPIFLKYCTGSDLVTDMKIIVQFSDCNNFASAPQFHTCTGILTLPSTYNSFIDFEYEMNNILSSDTCVMNLD